MKMRLVSPVILVFVSRCLLTVTASASADFGSKASLSTRLRRKSSNEATSTPDVIPEEESIADTPSPSSKTADETSVTNSESQSMGSPESLKLKPRVISLNIMVAGLAGLGKTTLCRALLDAWWQEIEEEGKDSAIGSNDKTKAGSIGRLGSLASSLSSSLSQATSSNTDRYIPSTPGRRTVSTTAISPSAPFEYFDEKANTILRVRIIDTPGFGNRVNHRNSVKPITDYISDCRSKRFRREQSPSFRLSRSNDEGDDNNRMLVHVCLYFLSPGRFLNIDRHFLKHVQDEVTIVPVIAKADTMTDDEIARYRAELARIWEGDSIEVYSLDEPDNRKRGFGSKSDTFYRGRRPGEVLAIISRDGIYPWGHSCALDPDHSDLVLIRDKLLSEHTERFLELATAKYVAYRDARIAKQSRSETLKYVALVGLAAIQLGRLEIQGTTLHEVVKKGLTVVAPFLQRLKLPSKLKLPFAGKKSDAGKILEEKEKEVPEATKTEKKNRGFPIRLFGKPASDSNGDSEGEPDKPEPEPSVNRRAFGFFRKENKATE